MQKRVPPADVGPTDSKKPKLIHGDADGHDEWSGFYTTKHLEQWMGPHYIDEGIRIEADLDEKNMIILLKDGQSYACKKSESRYTKGKHG